MEDERHFDDKELFCNRCEQMILIKHNQVGGFWHLSGWENKHGKKFFGGYCTPCYDKLHDEK